jgi:hypothetical protein
LESSELLQQKVAFETSEPPISDYENPGQIDTSPLSVYVAIHSLSIDFANCEIGGKIAKIRYCGGGRYHPLFYFAVKPLENRAVASGPLEKAPRPGKIRNAALLPKVDIFFTREIASSGACRATTPGGSPRS